VTTRGTLVYLGAGAAAALALLAWPAERAQAGFPDGPPPAHTGGFGEPTCRACHFDGDLNAEGGGLTRVMAYQAAEALKAGKLRIVLKEFELPAVPIHIVYPTSRLLSAKVRTFIDLVTEIADWHFG